MSIKKIAQLSGSSPATVSRILNNPNYKCSTPGLREKVWKIAMELNYTPNEAARSLKKGCSKNKLDTYSVDILMTRMEGANSDPFFAELLHCVESQIHAHSCILSSLWYKSLFSDDKKCEQTKLEPIIKEMIDTSNSNGKNGLLIIGKCNSRVIQILKKYYKHIVSINRNSTNYEVDEVICDGKKIAAMAVNYLVSLGHTRIAYVGRCNGESRYQGYKEVFHNNSMDFYDEYIMDIEQTEKQGFQTMKKLMQLDVPPTAIYCANDITAIGMIKCLNQYNSSLYIPSIISSDDIEEAQNTTPMLTTVKLPKENMAKFAVYLLLDRMKSGHNEVVRIELEGKLMIRNSCRRADETKLSEYYI